jgi:hypothetical protein
MRKMLAAAATLTIVGSRERGGDWCGERGYPGVRPTLHLGFQQ